MMNIIFQSAHKIAEMIRSREISAVEVLDAHLAQISKHNSKLNAICTL
jgi:amidase